MRSFCCGLAVLLGTGIWAGSVSYALAEDVPFKAGVAVKVITPTEPLWMAGYANRTKPAEGKLHDLHVKALALEDSHGTKLVLLTSDLLGLPRHLSDAVAEDVRRRTGLPRERLLLTSSHTHCGPVLAESLQDMYPLTADQPAKIAAYTDRLRGLMVEIIVAALADLRPARLSVGAGTARFAVNRRQVTDKGITNGVNPGGPVDHSVPVLRVECHDGKLRAVVFGYACHNTTLQFYQWCGDYAGFAQADVEKKYPGAVALFWMGCGADANPLPRGKVELCEQYGRELAAAVDGVLRGPTVPVRGRFAAEYAQISLPFDRLPTEAQLSADLLNKNHMILNRAARLLKVLGRDGKLDDQYPHYPVQAWRLGEQVLWVALGGEVVVDYARRLKKELAGSAAVWVTGYANDVMAYIPSLRVLKEGGYEGDTSMIPYGLPTRWAPPIEEKIVAKVHDLVQAVSANPEPLSRPSRGPLSPKEELATFRVPPSFRVELVAAEPDVVDPVAMAFDEDGRLYVAEMRGYPNAGVGHGKISTGKIRRLEDRDGDGVYETSTTFADGLRFPTSVLPWNGGLIVAVAPDLIFLEDRDGDGRADHRRTLYTGFDLDNIQQLVNSLQWGLDNWVYACAGGKGGVVRSAEKADSPRVTLHGRGIRFHPEKPGSLEPTSGGGQFGLASDDWQNWFTATNSQHLRQIILPDHYLRRNPYLALSAVALDIPDHGAACKVNRISPFEAWRVERTQRRKGGPDAKRFPSTELVPGGFITSACSPVVSTAGVFPDEYRGNSFVCDPANNLIHRDRLVPSGSIFSAERADKDCEFLASTDNWFRPVNLTIGPDGALYVADFYREVIETPLSLPEDIKKWLNLESRGRGRIWRVVPEGHPARQNPKLGKAPASELVSLLGNPNPWWRLTAQRLLVERQDRAVALALAKLARSAQSAQGRAHALWTLHGLHALENDHIMHAMHDAEPEVRAQALRLSEERFGEGKSLRDAAIKLAGDTARPVRFQVAFSLGAIDDPAATAALTRIIRESENDPWLQAAVLSSARHCAAAILAMLASDAEFVAGERPDRVRLLGDLAAIVGTSGDGAGLRQVLHVLRADAAGLQDWQLAVLEGVGKGLRRGGRSLSQFWRDQSAAGRTNSLPRYFKEAAATAVDSQRPLARRTTAVRVLGYGPFEEVAPGLRQLLQPQQPAEIQLAAVAALSLHDDAQVANSLLESWGAASPGVRREITEALFARADRLRALLGALEKGQLLISQFEPSRRDQLRTHRDPTIRRRAAALLAKMTASDRKQIVDAYRPALDLSAAAARGKEVFRKNCSTCHRLENVGVEVGPDLLSALRNKSGETLLADILDPSREVDPRYINYVLTTADGRALTGMIAAETPSSLTLRRAERAEDTVLRSQIEEIKATAKSVMPEELEKQLSKQDVADVIAYLLAVGGQPTDRRPRAYDETGSTAPPFYTEKTQLLLYRDAQGQNHPITTAADWTKRREHILANMQQVMGRLPDDSQRVPLDVRVEEEIKTDKFVRKKLTFAVEKGDRLWAYLFVPCGSQEKRAGVLCLHPTSPKLGKGIPAGLGEKPDLHYAVHLAERGYVTLAPDYVNSGDYRFDAYAHGYASATMKGIWNHMRCVDLLQSLPEVDPERIGVIGHSLGGHNSMFMAVFDPRLKCVVSNCGFCRFPRYYGGNLKGWSHTGYMPRIRSVYHLDPTKMPFDFTEVVAALAPRPFLASAPVRDANFDVQGVKDCIAAAKPVYELFGAADRLAANYPDCEHDFPPDARKVAYDWLDRWLKKK